MTSIKDPKGNLTQIAYDAQGNPLTLSDADNKVTTFTYDSRGLLRTTTQTDLMIKRLPTPFISLLSVEAAVYGLESEQTREIKQLQDENAKLKPLVAMALGVQPGEPRRFLSVSLVQLLVCIVLSSCRVLRQIARFQPS